MTIKFKTFDLFANTSATYDQNLTSLIGKITQKTLNGNTVVGPPLVKYRNTIGSSESITPNDIYVSENNRMFITTTETGGLVTCLLYDIDPDTNDMTYDGKITFQVNDSPSTTHTIRGFRVIDDGTTGWKIFWLSTANQAANAGLYMVNNVDLVDFQAVPVNFPQATAGGQKAVYKLENSPFDITSGGGISIDKGNSLVFVHNGVAANHKFIVFDYSLAISTVTSGATTDLFLHETGALPVLSGTLLVTNSEEFSVPLAGPNANEDCLVFFTTTNCYRVRLADLSNGATSLPSLEFVNLQPGVNVLTAQTAARATFSDVYQKIIMVSSSNMFIVKNFEDNQADFFTQIEGYDNDEVGITKEMYPFRVGAVSGFDTKNGYVAILSTTTGQRGIYIGNFDCEDLFDSSYIISPVIDAANERLLRFTVGIERPDLASPICVYYRFSGFGSESSGWVLAPDNYSLGGIVSPTGQVQFKITYKVFANNSTNPLQISSAGVLVQSNNVISDNWEFSNSLTEDTLTPVVAFRLKKAYTSAVPTLYFRSYSLTDTLVVENDSVTHAAKFEYSTDNGVVWNALGTIPNTVGTLVRYTFDSPVGVDIRPSLREP